MSQDGFYSLLKKYQKGRCSAEEQKIVEQWYEQLGEQEPIETIDPEKIQLIERRIWNQIELKTTTKQNNKRLLWPRWTAATAATIGLLLVLIWGLNRSAQPEAHYFSSENVSSIEQYVNDGTKLKEINLPDGSLVQLYPGAKVSVPSSFQGNKREVFLIGTAFFDVHKNKNKPFFVYSDALVTEVVGTSFTVKADKGLNEVEVATGKVYVSKTLSKKVLSKGNLPENEKIMLTPNQKVVLENSGQLKAGIVQEPKVLANQSFPTSDFNYQAIGLADIFQDLELHYGIKIEIGANLMACSFTGDLNQQDLFSQLSLICETMGLTYQKQGIKIIVSGPGCDN